MRNELLYCVASVLFLPLYIVAVLTKRSEASNFFSDNSVRTRMLSTWDEKLKIYCINLDRRQDRWNYTSKQLRSDSLELKRVSAVDGKTLNLSGVDPKICAKHYTNYYGMEFKQLKKRNIPVYHRNASRSEIGCSLSHYKVWKDTLAEPYTIIVEDDIRFGDGLGVHDIKNVYMKMSILI